MANNKTVERRKGEKSDLQVLEVLSDDTRGALKRHNAKISVRAYKDSNSRKYSRKKPKNVLYFNNGYDLLQYNIVVRPYIMKKYNIEKQIELDVLLYLFPLQYFTMKDFRVLLTSYHNYGLKTMIEMGYVELCIERRNHGAKVYTLTEHAVKIVKDYYRYLSGEKTINPDSYTNPFKGPEARKIDKAREKVMLKLKRQSENFPSLFRKKLYS